MPNSNLGLDFLNRSLRTSGAVLLIFFPFGVYYLGFYPTLAVFSGGVWGIVNILFLSTVVRSAIRPEGVAVQPLILALLVKFPLLYLAGYALLKVPYFAPLNLLIGFSVCLAVILLKALGRMILGLDSQSKKHEKLHEAV
jgi:hypothetical protein